MLLKLFLSFAYIGTFTFGGGYAMLPMFQRILVEKHNWLTKAEMSEFFSVGQCLPGVISTNTAVIVGNRQKGILGGAAAVLGVAAPSIILIIIIASFLQNFAHYPIVQRAFLGLRVCVSVLILNTVTKLWKAEVVDKPAILIFAVVFLISVFTNVPVALLVVAAGFCGVIIMQFRRRKTSGTGGTL
jgi:chromate transporter